MGMDGPQQVWGKYMESFGRALAHEPCAGAAGPCSLCRARPAGAVKRAPDVRPAAGRSVSYSRSQRRTSHTPEPPPSLHSALVFSIWTLRPAVSLSAALWRLRSGSGRATVSGSPGCDKLRHVTVTRDHVTVTGHAASASIDLDVRRRPWTKCWCACGTLRGCVSRHGAPWSRGVSGSSGWGPLPRRPQPPSGPPSSVMAPTSAT
eukprot:975994-Prymnesium_polylepis.1